jgi:hypothetical protein
VKNGGVGSEKGRSADIEGGGERMDPESQKKRGASNFLKRFTSRFLLSFSLLFAGCLTSRVTLPPVLPTNPPMDAADLAARVNELQKITRLRANAQIQFTDFKESERGKGKAYPSVTGDFVLQRPQQIRLQVSASLIGAIADMASDGERFRVAVIYPADKQSFITGMNRKRYAFKSDRMVMGKDSRDVGTLSQIRPQHLSMPLLPPPVPAPSPEALYSVFEAFREEVETPPAVNGRSSEPPRRVTKTYYVLHVATRRPDGRWSPNFSYWFDRTRKGTPLARLEAYEEDGTLTTVSEFDGYSNEEGMPQALPKTVQIMRPQEGYAMRVTFQKPEINPDALPSDVFTLRNEGNFRVIDLDAQR